LSANLAVLHVAPAATPAARFGISVGKRSAKSAVDRNRIKRRARELFRRQSLKHAKADVVVTLTSRFDVAQLDTLMVELEQLLEAARARLQG
jgi:ribonuclease P protein component